MGFKTAFIFIIIGHIIATGIKTKGVCKSWKLTKMFQTA